MWRTGFSAVLLACSVAGHAIGQPAGTLTAWGRNDLGQCNVPTGDDFAAIAGGRDHGVALKSDGSVVAWGHDQFGQVSGTPTGNNFVAIAAGSYHNVALKANGSLVSWGLDMHGEVSETPIGNDFTAVAAGAYSSFAFKSDGSLVVWGAFDSVPPGSDLLAIAPGSAHVVGLKADGSLLAWGNNTYGQCDVPAGNDFTALGQAIWYHSLALRADGSLEVWGWDPWGQVSGTPVGNDFVAAAAGEHHSIALRADGSLTAWGRNTYGQCNVPPGNNFVAIAPGQNFGVALAVDNRAPIADAGPDQEVQCTGNLTTVTLNATGSSDPDGDALGYEWSLPEGSDATVDDPFSATPTGQFPLGPTLVTLTVTDGKGGVACADVLITIVDNIPPVLVATTDKIALWPPNHEIHEVLVRVEITDCAWDTSAIVPALLSSSELDDGTGDGSYVNDVNGEDGFTAPVLMDLIYTGEAEPGVYLYEGLACLRAERDGSERGRVYSVVCDVVDLAGNTSTASCVVVVPHDRRKN